MNTKRKRPQRSVPGIPGVDRGVGLDWLFANIDKTTGSGANLGEIARIEFEGGLGEYVGHLLKVALSEHDTVAKEWAGKLLARVSVSLHKHDGKLRQINAAYRKRKAKIGKTRADVAVPRSVVGQALQEELRTAERHQFKLLVLREQIKGKRELRAFAINKGAIETRIKRDLKRQTLTANTRIPTDPQMMPTIPLEFWPKDVAAGARKEIEEWVDSRGQEIAREHANAPLTLLDNEVVGKKSVRVRWEDVAKQWGIPREYWPTANLPRFCASSERAWWKFIWSRLNDRQAELLPRLRESGKGRAEAKNEPLYLKHFYKQFRKHWLTLVRLREAGIF